MEKKQKAWVVIRTSKIEIDEARQLHFELQDHLEPSKIFLTFTSKRQAKRWRDKWYGGNETMRVVPCEIIYSPPLTNK